MANFTALKTAINNAIRTNGNEEITGAVLQVILDAMVETLGDGAINALETALAAEVTNRENAVGGVAGDLAAETLARANKDNQLDGRINQEEYNRQNADAALSHTVDQGFQTLNSQMNALNAAISALNAAYQNGFLYGGIATPSSSPSNNKCFYIALQGGTYTNFGGVGVVEGINIIKNDSGWKVDHIYDQTTLLNEFYLLRQQVIQAITSFAPIVIEGNVTNAPDEEDLTSNAQHLLQFKNNAYSPLEFSGLGRKYLRKNIAPLSESAPFSGFVEGVTAEATLSGTPTQIFWDRMNTRFVGFKDGVYYLDWTDSVNYVPVSTSLVYMYNGTPYQWTGSDFIVDETEVPNLVNCLTQDMINEANTIYIIRYDYTLKEDVTIPANCVLEFEGGSISNASGNSYSIEGNNTGIKAELVAIFKDMATLSGTWNIDDAYSDWFTSQNVYNDMNSLTALANNANADHVTNIYVNRDIQWLPTEASSLFNISNSVNLYLNGTITVQANSLQRYYVIFLENTTNVHIIGGSIIGDRQTHGTNAAEHCHGIELWESKNVTISGTHISYMPGDGIYLGGGDGSNSSDLTKANEFVVIENCVCRYNGRQGISVASSINELLIDNCEFSYTGVGNVITAQNGPWAGIDIEPTVSIGLLKNIIIRNTIFKKNKSHQFVVATNIQLDDIVVENCIFEADTFTENNEKVFIESSSVYIVGNIGAININSSVLKGILLVSNGRAVTIDKSSINLNDCSIYGGILAIDDNVSNPNREWILNNCHFECQKYKYGSSIVENFIGIGGNVSLVFNFCDFRRNNCSAGIETWGGSSVANTFDKIEFRNCISDFMLYGTLVIGCLIDIKKSLTSISYTLNCKGFKFIDNKVINRTNSAISNIMQWYRTIVHNDIASSVTDIPFEICDNEFIGSYSNEMPIDFTYWYYGGGSGKVNFLFRGNKTTDKINVDYSVLDAIPQLTSRAKTYTIEREFKYPLEAGTTAQLTAFKAICTPQVGDMVMLTDTNPAKPVWYNGTNFVDAGGTTI